jgi:predicted nucleotidyltransferase
LAAIFAIGNPVAFDANAEDLETLKILGKKLKKNNIAVDLVCFGDVSQ